MTWKLYGAEIAGGLLLIGISTVLIRLTYPKKWFEQARKTVEAQSNSEQDDFDWRDRIRSRAGWNLVGHRFVSDWKMVWREILIGFTVAGFVAVLVPASLWASIFLTEARGLVPDWLIVVENAMVAPLVAAATFIGSMGNIPLATVLNSNGVTFAGIMGFIYSDLMVPPLVMHYLFAALNITPESSNRVQEIVQFSLDYTFYLNLVFVLLAAGLVWLHRRHMKESQKEMNHQMETGGALKRNFARLSIGVLLVGMVAYFSTS